MGTSSTHPSSSGGAPATWVPPHSEDPFAASPSSSHMAGALSAASPPHSGGGGGASVASHAGASASCAGAGAGMSLTPQDEDEVLDPAHPEFPADAAGVMAVATPAQDVAGASVLPPVQAGAGFVPDGGALVLFFGLGRTLTAPCTWCWVRTEGFQSTSLSLAPSRGASSRASTPFCCCGCFVSSQVGAAGAGAGTGAGTEAGTGASDGAGAGAGAGVLLHKGAAATVSATVSLFSHWAGAFLISGVSDASQFGGGPVTFPARVVSFHKASSATSSKTSDDDHAGDLAGLAATPFFMCEFPTKKIAFFLCRHC